METKTDNAAVATESTGAPKTSSDKEEEKRAAEIEEEVVHSKTDVSGANDE